MFPIECDGATGVCVVLHVAPPISHIVAQFQLAWDACERRGRRAWTDERIVLPEFGWCA